jgi:hypothetical protein
MPTNVDFLAPQVEEAIVIPEQPAVKPWPVAARILFRIAFLYFFCFLFLFGNGTLFDLFPVVGGWIDSVLNWPFDHLAEWTGEHVFHLTGIAAHWHPTGSGDTTLHWILNGLFLVFSLTGGIVWTIVAMLRGNRRKEYNTLYAWLRFGLRITCGLFMLNYGLAKVFPFQMAPISVGILNEPVGNMSPMTFLWALIGMNPVYEMVCGAAEVIGGVLLLYRRTALLGALISAFVMANVVLYNFFFDVPVKLFAVNLLLAICFLTLPDAQSLFSYFWLHRPTAPSATWIPPAKRRWYRITLLTVEWVFCLGLLIMMPISDGIGWFQSVAANKVQTPLIGSWKLDATHPASGSFITGEGLPATDLYIDTAARGLTRASDGALWRTRFKLDAKAHTLRISDFPTDAVTYSFQMPDNNHLILTSVAPDSAKNKSGAKPAAPFTPAVVTLTRTPIPAHYPLLDRGFHYVNQWGLER